jgi:hypothetical protein
MQNEICRPVLGVSTGVCIASSKTNAQYNLQASPWVEDMLVGESGTGVAIKLKSKAGPDVVKLMLGGSTLDDGQSAVARATEAIDNVKLLFSEVDRLQLDLVAVQEELAALKAASAQELRLLG